MKVSFVRGREKNKYGGKQGHNSGDTYVCVEVFKYRRATNYNLENVFVCMEFVDALVAAIIDRPHCFAFASVGGSTAEDRSTDVAVLGLHEGVGHPVVCRTCGITKHLDAGLAAN